jgi:hypothetical protein
MPETLPNQGFSYDPIDQGLSEAEVAYRTALGDALEVVLGNGANDLAAIAAGLNELGLRGGNGERWTEGLVEAELNRLSR